MVKNQRRKSQQPALKSVLKRYGFKRAWFVAYQAEIIVGIILVLPVAAGLTFSFLWNVDGINSAIMIITLEAVVLAYQQWNEAKNETSIDKYYERLDLTNRRLNNWSNARAMFPYFWEGKEQASFEKTMYVYLELDNLEYAVEKYRLGYMSAEVAYRGLETFKSRCQSPEFRQLALKYVRKSIGYHEITERVVLNIVKEFEED